VAVYSQLYDTDYGYACQTVTQSTLFSIVTMPVIIWIAERLF
jgi:predicted permease